MINTLSQHHGQAEGNMPVIMTRLECRLNHRHMHNYSSTDFPSLYTLHIITFIVFYYIVSSSNDINAIFVPSQYQGGMATDD